MKRPTLPPGRFLLVVSAADAGKRLDAYLAARLGRSRSSIVKQFERRVFDEAGTPLRWAHRVVRGQRVVLQGQSRPEPHCDVSYEIVFRDEHVLAVNKPPGVPVHPSRSWRRNTLVTRIREDLQMQSIGLAHRLDRETSGVVVLGLGREAINALMKQFAGHGVRKQYLAVVWGTPAFDEKTICKPLARDSAFPVPCRMAPTSDGSEALTELRVLWRGTDRTLVSARPLTGRQHQIRVHLAAIGHPVLGDKLYMLEGRAYLDMMNDRLEPRTLELLGHTRHALHAYSVQLRHPATGELMVLHAPVPDDMLSLLPRDAWRLVGGQNLLYPNVAIKQRSGLTCDKYRSSCAAHASQKSKNHPE